MADDATTDAPAPATPRRLATGSVGLWTGTLDALAPAQAQAVVGEIEALGYAALWYGEAYGREAFLNAALYLSATSSMVIATGIANIYGRDPMAAAGAARGLEGWFPGRFVLGVGVSHAPLVERMRGHEYGSPIATMSDWLEKLAGAPFFAAPADLPPVVVAALGPKMLRLSADKAQGAHPYNVTPGHTATARAEMGPDAMLCVEHAAVLGGTREEYLRRAHEHLNIYTGLPNYRNSWLREGFTADDFVRGGSERLCEAMVAWGDEAAIRAKVDEHLAAGADHVCVQVLGQDIASPPLDDWRRLAPALTGR